MLNAFRHHRGRHAFTVRYDPASGYGAQRLSASQRSAPLISASAGRLRLRMCSTPFGITEVGTAVHSVVELSRASAQRLSASQRSARWHRGPADAGRPCGAQRLSASQRSAQHATANGASSATCSTPFGITEVGTLQVPASRCERRSTMCSTPFGITEVGTIRTVHAIESTGAGAQRLSASLRSARSREQRPR